MSNPTLDPACDYLSTLGLTLYHVSKGVPGIDTNGLRDQMNICIYMFSDVSSNAKLNSIKSILSRNIIYHDSQNWGPGLYYAYSLITENGPWLLSHFFSEMYHKSWRRSLFYVTSTFNEHCSPQDGTQGNITLLHCDLLIPPTQCPILTFKWGTWSKITMWKKNLDTWISCWMYVV